MSPHRYTVACLTGNGLGPELMAEACRALDAASRLHGFGIEDEHASFGGDAFMRFGHPYPSWSRQAVLAADAVLLAPGTDEPLDVIEDELDLRASIVRVRFDAHGVVSILSPRGRASWNWTLRRAFQVARAGRASVTVVGAENGWGAEVEEVVRAHDAFAVDRLDSSEAARLLVLAPQRLDVVVCPPEFADAAAGLAACNAARRVTAWGELAASGPGLFGAVADAGDDLAGAGVADPSAMLLAAALLLGEGLGERSAAATLGRAVARVEMQPQPSTRGHGDRVLAALPLGLDVEFHAEAAG